jgi:3-methyl-2-oxobutanoate hydroxymethyltransferase
VQKKSKITVPQIKSRKGDKISVLTAYSYNTAKILDEIVDIVLVGDSLGMVLYGMKSTLEVTLPIMINHGKAVAKACNRALVVVDMPFGSYQSSPSKAFNSAAKILAQTGAGAVKLEGGVEMVETIKFLVERGIPVMAHIGLQPQQVNIYGGYKKQGITKQDQEKILKDAKAVEKGGAFSVVLECVDENLAEKITKALKIPTIGIGASKKCDGQVLVTDDLVGLTEFTPPFVKKLTDLSAEIKKAAKIFAN